MNTVQQDRLQGAAPSCSLPALEPSSTNRMITDAATSAAWTVAKPVLLVRASNSAAAARTVSAASELRSSQPARATPSSHMQKLALEPQVFLRMTLGPDRLLNLLGCNRENIQNINKSMELQRGVQVSLQAEMSNARSSLQGFLQSLPQTFTSRIARRYCDQFSRVQLEITNAAIFRFLTHTYPEGYLADLEDFVSTILQKLTLNNAQDSERHLIYLAVKSVLIETLEHPSGESRTTAAVSAAVSPSGRATGADERIGSRL